MRTPELLAGLKKLRSSLARAAGLPSYCVFSDSTLTEIAGRSPRTTDELLVGQGRRSGQGVQVRAVLSQADRRSCRPEVTRHLPSAPWHSLSVV
jgi:superfamily II DNA helicase RecQ